MTENRYPRDGDTISVRVTEGWPTPNHVRRAADAIDAISIPKIGAILRAAADGIDAGAIETPKPWESAAFGEAWAFTTWGGTRRLFIRTTGGWRPVARRKTLAQSRELRDGVLVWKPEYAYEPQDCPQVEMHAIYSKCGLCGHEPSDTEGDS